MTVTTREKKLLIALIGVLAVAYSYFFIFRPTAEKNEDLSNENTQLSARLSDLKGKQDKEEEYVSETVRLNLEVETLLKEYPSYLMYENEIMDVVDLENRTGVSVSSLTILDPVAVSVDTQSSEGDAADQYVLYDVNTNLSYTATYSVMKNMLDRIVSVQNKRSISTFSATLDNSTGEITGVLNFDSYFIYGQEKNYESANIPDIKHGTNNIFGSVDYDVDTDVSDSDAAQEEE
jgi:Tfp pilus assembly protein PilO